MPGLSQKGGYRQHGPDSLVSGRKDSKCSTRYIIWKRLDMQEVESSRRSVSKRKRGESMGAKSMVGDCRIGNSHVRDRNQNKSGEDCWIGIQAKCSE
jgi:hypothetical protein